jgi:hypothetical protein
LFAVRKWQKIAEDDELTEIRKDRRPEMKHSSSDTASFWLSLRQEYPISTETATEALLPLSTPYLCGPALLCYEHDEEQEQVAASSTGGGLVGMLVNHPTSDKGPHEASPRTGVH